MAIKVANNQSLTAITALPSGVSAGAMNLLETQTASSSSTISFTSNIDDTYDEYVFKFYNIHPASNSVILQFNLSTDSGSNYNVTKTSTYFRSLHNEGGSSTNVVYQTSHDLAQSTSFQDLAQGIGNDNDQCTVGTLQLFNPSSDTFVKHFISRFNTYEASDFSIDQYCAGYGNTTSAVDAVQFKMSSGNMDAGVIKLYGIS